MSGWMSTDVRAALKLEWLRLGRQTRGLAVQVQSRWSSCDCRPRGCLFREARL